MKQLQKYGSLGLLIGFNIYAIWYYRQHQDGFKTLLILYWFQSVMLGFFTFLQLLTAPSKHGAEAKEEKTISSKPGCGAFFFLFHYGMFHLVYLVFIVVRKDGSFDYDFLRISMAIIILVELMEFIRKKRIDQAEGTNFGLAFFLPYLRIIPMHLAIIGASFLHWNDITLFLVLKTFADVGMHLLTGAMYLRSTTA